MEEKELLGLKKNVTFGLSWILFPIGIVCLAVEYKKLDREEKQQLISIFVLDAIGMILSAIINSLVQVFNTVELPVVANIVGIVGWVLSIPLFICWLVAMIQAFRSQYWKVPVAYSIAGAFLPKEEMKKETEEEKKEE